MVKMDEKTYLEIYDSVNTFEDVERISNKIHEPVGIAATILQQKIVRKVIINHGRMQRYTKRHLRTWEEGSAILHIAQRNKFPATLMAAMILKEMGHSKKYINIMFKNPETIRNRRLRVEVMQALNADYFYSPKAHQKQRARGQMGEDIIEKWLEVQDIVHCNENDLRKNGKGKTTLLKLLSGNLKPHSGEITLHTNAQTGYFAQTNTINLNPNYTIEEEFTAAGCEKQMARNIAGAMMFEGDDALKKIEILSGGEKSRVLLGKILAAPANLLFLDEPTNHLDMECFSTPLQTDL